MGGGRDINVPMLKNSQIYQLHFGFQATQQPFESVGN